MSDYWSNFNDWKNTTGVEVVHSNGTEGDSALHTIGSSWLYQEGDATTHMFGNMGWKQTGVSNTLIEGINFFTVLGMSTNTTVGMGIDSYFGLRVGINYFGTVDVTSAKAVRLSRGPYYEIDETERWTTAAQKKELLDEELKAAKKTVELIEEEIQTIATKINRIGMEHEIRVGKIMHVATGDATFIGISTTCGSTVGPTMLNGISVKITATTSATILSKGPAWINGAVVKIG